MLIEKGFACNNVVLGAGSFSMQCLETGDTLAPFTRDTFHIAVKATYCEDKNGKQIPIYKAPKNYRKINGEFIAVEDSPNHEISKKSHRGMCCVYKDDNGEIVCRDGYTTDTIKETADINMFVPVFRDGRMLREYSLAEIRNRLHGGKF